MMMFDSFCDYRDSVLNDLVHMSGLRFLNVIIENSGHSDYSTQDQNDYSLTIVLSINDKYYDDYPGFSHISITCDYDNSSISASESFLPYEDFTRVIKKTIILYDLLFYYAAQSSYSSIRDFVPFLVKSRLTIGRGLCDNTDGENVPPQSLLNSNDNAYIITVINELYDKFVLRESRDNITDDDVSLLIVVFMSMFIGGDFSLNILRNPDHYNTISPLSTLLLLTKKYSRDSNVNTYYHNSFYFSMSVVLMIVLSEENRVFFDEVVRGDGSLVKWLFTRGDVSLYSCNDIVDNIRLFVEKYEVLLKNAGVDTSNVWEYATGNYHKIVKNHHATYVDKWVKLVFNYPYECLFEHNDYIVNTIDFSTIEFLYRRDFFMIVGLLSDCPHDYSNLDIIAGKLRNNQYLVKTNGIVDHIVKTCSSNDVYKVSLVLFTVFLLVERHNNYPGNITHRDYDSYISVIVEKVLDTRKKSIVSIRKDVITSIIMPMVFYFNDPVKMDKVVRLCPLVYDYCADNHYEGNYVCEVVSYLLDNNDVYSMIVHEGLSLDHVINIVFKTYALD